MASLSADATAAATAWLAACRAEAETGGVADRELRELSPQLFSSITRAGDFMSILGRLAEKRLLLNSISGRGAIKLESLRSASRNSARFLRNSSSVDSYFRCSFFKSSGKK